jgi:hypothetical protein
MPCLDLLDERGPGRLAAQHHVERHLIGNQLGGYEDVVKHDGLPLHDVELSYECLDIYIIKLYSLRCGS